MLSTTRSFLLIDPTTQPFFLLEKRTLYSSTSAPSNSSGAKMRDCDQLVPSRVTKIDVVYPGLRADVLAYPRFATVRGVAEVTTVAANPAAFAVEKVDRVEIASACVDLVRHPALCAC